MGGAYTPYAATQFQWQATHPASNGAYVTSWGGYSLAPSAVAATPQGGGNPAIYLPPPQHSLQPLPPPNQFGGQTSQAQQPPLYHQPPPHHTGPQPQYTATLPPPPGLPQQGGTTPVQQTHTSAATSQPVFGHHPKPMVEQYQSIHAVRYPQRYDPDTDPWHADTPPPSPRTQAAGGQNQPHTAPPQPNSAFAVNPPWALTQEQAASLLAESPTLQAQQQRANMQTQPAKPASKPSGKQHRQGAQASPTPPTDHPTPSASADLQPDSNTATWPDNTWAQTTQPAATAEAGEQQSTTADTPEQAQAAAEEEATAGEQQQKADQTHTAATQGDSEAKAAEEPPQTGDEPTSATRQPADKPLWGKSEWGTGRNAPTSSTRRSESSAGHGSQRVQNKAGKYTYKQHNKRGLRQKRPPPQKQGGPGWGILYKPQLPTEAASSGEATSSSDSGQATPTPGSKAATYAHEQAKARFAELLNKHLEPRHSRATDQQAQQPATATNPQHGPEQPAHHTQANSNTAQSQDTAAAAQAEWASTQPGHFEGELPPPIFFSTATGSSQEYRPLTHGCWELRIEASSNPAAATATAAAGLPPLRTVRVGQRGPLETAPPFPSGMIGRVAPMPQPGQWLLIVTYVPDLDTCEPNSLLVAEGDQFIAHQTDKGWILSVERLAASTARNQRQNTTAATQPGQQSGNPSETTAQAATAAANSQGGDEDEGSEEAEADDHGDGRPPRLPLSEQAEAQMTQLGDGRWQIEVARDKSSGKPATPSGLPRTVIEGDGGPVSRAPALPIGTVGTFEILTPEMWLLDIVEAPDHTSYETDTMLLVPGDRLLLEYQDSAWHMRIEHLASDAPGPVMRLRQRRRNLLAAERRARAQTTHKQDQGGLESIPEHNPPPSHRDEQAESSNIAVEQSGNPTAAAAADREGGSASSSSSHEPPRSYYPQTRPKPSPDTTTNPSRAHHNTLSDGRELRKSQRKNRPAEPTTNAAQSSPQQQPTTSSRTTAKAKAETPLAELLSDGRKLGRGRQPPPAPDADTSTTTSTTSAPTTAKPTTGESSTTTTTTADQDDDYDNAYLMQTHLSGHTTPQTSNVLQQAEAPTQPEPPTTPVSSQSGGQQTQAMPETSSHSHSHSRSWQRVEQGLQEIRRMAQEYDDTQHRQIAATAEAAIVDLLVDTPTAQQLEAAGTAYTTQTAYQQTQPPPGGNTPPLDSITAAAKQACTQLRSIAGELLRSREPVIVSYAMVAPHVEALICWFGTLEQGDVAVHIQLPPILTPLREILCDILEGRPGGPEMWAKLVAVAEALEALLTGKTLAHPADVVMLNEGGTNSTLLREGVTPEWYRAVETLRGLLNDVSKWPPRVLPTVQEAAMNLVRGIAARTPEETMAGREAWQPDEWWYKERHHGMGDSARASSSPRGPAQRRPRSPSYGGSSDRSHRRRRILAEHMHGDL